MQYWNRQISITHAVAVWISKYLKLSNENVDVHWSTLMGGCSMQEARVKVSTHLSQERHKISTATEGPSESSTLRERPNATARCCCSLQ